MSGHLDRAFARSTSDPTKGHPVTTLAGNDPDRSRDYAEVYVDAAGEHRWRYKAGNGQVIAVSGEGYRNGIDALRGLGIVTGRVPTFDENAETKDVAVGPNNIRVVRLARSE